MGGFLYINILTLFTNDSLMKDPRTWPNMTSLSFTVFCNKELLHYRTRLRHRILLFFLLLWLLSSRGFGLTLISGTSNVYTIYCSIQIGKAQAFSLSAWDCKQTKIFSYLEEESKLCWFIWSNLIKMSYWYTWEVHILLDDINKVTIVNQHRIRSPIIQSLRRTDKVV